MKMMERAYASNIEATSKRTRKGDVILYISGRDGVPLDLEVLGRAVAGQRQRRMATTTEPVANYHRRRWQVYGDHDSD